MLAVKYSWLSSHTKITGLSRGADVGRKIIVRRVLPWDEE